MTGDGTAERRVQLEQKRMKRSRLAWVGFVLGLVGFIVQVATITAIVWGYRLTDPSRPHTNFSSDVDSGSAMIHDAYAGAIVSTVLGLAASVVGLVAFIRLLASKRSAGVVMTVFAVVLGLLAAGPGLIEILLAFVAHALRGVGSLGV